MRAKINIFFDTTNRNDEKIIKDAFKNKANLIIQRVNELNSELFKIDYFDYYRTTRYQGLIGFVGYKVRPNMGSRVPENVDLNNISFSGRTIAYEETPTLIIEADKVKFVGSYVDTDVTGGAKIMWMKPDGSFVKAVDNSDATKDFTNYCFHAYFDLTGAGFASAPLIIVEEADGSTLCFV